MLAVPNLICPACRTVLTTRGGANFSCARCARDFSEVAGLADLRLHSDRYLSMAAERVKAERLHAVAAEPGADLARVANAYYEQTDDVADHRRVRFLRHINSAEARGHALASLLPQSGLILEVGCGTGGLLVAAARSGRSIVGVDIASRWLVVARRRLADQDLQVPLVVAGTENLPWSDDSFEVVIADSLLEHLDDPSNAFREWSRVLRPGGSLLVWSPNRFSLTTDPHLGLWGLGWLPRSRLAGYLQLRRRTDWPPRTLSPWDARRLALSSGLERVSVAVPRIPQAWAQTRSHRERIAIRTYAAMRALPVARNVLRSISPLWELRAEVPTSERGAA